MAGIKPQNIAEFYRSLRERGATLQSLAGQIGLQRHSYVSRLVNGHGRRRDGVWWPKLKALLTPDELTLIDRYNYPTVAAAVAALPGQGIAQEETEVTEGKTGKHAKPPSALSSPPSVLSVAAAFSLRKSPSCKKSETAAAFHAWRNQRKSA